MSEFVRALQKVAGKGVLSREESRAAIAELMTGVVPAVQIAGFLVALRVRGETVDEIAGAADAMRSAAVAVPHKEAVLADTCGTGGDGQGTFNISTAAAFVVAGAGIPVAKHGNRSVSSKSGSADVLEASGIRIELSPEEAAQALAKHRVAFLFAQAFHPAMKHAGPVRRELGLRTIFNLLGPLTNPAHPHVQLIGVYDPAWVLPLAEVLSRLGCRYGAVVHGQGHDELVLTGPTQVAEITDGRVSETVWSPGDFGLSVQPQAKVTGGSAAENAQILERVLRGEAGPYLEAVAMNAAVVIRAAEAVRSGRLIPLKDAYELARQSIEKGAAWRSFEGLRRDFSKGAVRG